MQVGFFFHVFACVDYVQLLGYGISVQFYT